MDEDATWYGSRPRRRPHCISRVPSAPRKRHSTPPPSLRPMSIVATVAHLSYCWGLVNVSVVLFQNKCFNFFRGSMPPDDYSDVPRIWRSLLTHEHPHQRILSVLGSAYFLLEIHLAKQTHFTITDCTVSCRKVRRLFIRGTQRRSAVSDQYR